MANAVRRSGEIPKLYVGTCTCELTIRTKCAPLAAAASRMAARGDGASASARAGFSRIRRAKRCAASVSFALLADMPLARFTCAPLPLIQSKGTPLSGKCERSDYMGLLGGGPQRESRLKSLNLSFKYIPPIRCVRAAYPYENRA